MAESIVGENESKVNTEDEVEKTEEDVNKLVENFKKPAQSDDSLNEHEKKLTNGIHNSSEEKIASVKEPKRMPVRDVPTSSTDLEKPPAIVNTSNGEEPKGTTNVDETTDNKPNSNEVSTPEEDRIEGEKVVSGKGSKRCKQKEFQHERSETVIDGFVLFSYSTVEDLKLDGPVKPPNAAAKKLQARAKKQQAEKENSDSPSPAKKRREKREHTARSTALKEKDENDSTAKAEPKNKDGPKTERKRKSTIQVVVPTTIAEEVVKENTEPVKGEDSLPVMSVAAPEVDMEKVEIANNASSTPKKYAPALSVMQQIHNLKQDDALFARMRQSSMITTQFTLQDKDMHPSFAQFLNKNPDINKLTVSSADSSSTVDSRKQIIIQDTEYKSDNSMSTTHIEKRKEVLTIEKDHHSASTSQEPLTQRHVHQHEHKHQHQHQHQHFHPPPYGTVPTHPIPPQHPMFYQGLGSGYMGMPILPQPIRHTSPVIKPPAIRTGKWSSAHVQIAHFIQKAQTKAKLGLQSSDSAPRAFQLVPPRNSSYRHTDQDTPTRHIENPTNPANRSTYDGRGLYDSRSSQPFPAGSFTALLNSPGFPESAAYNRSERALAGNRMNPYPRHPAIPGAGSVAIKDALDPFERQYKSPDRNSSQPRLDYMSPFSTGFGGLGMPFGPGLAGYHSSLMRQHAPLTPYPALPPKSPPRVHHARSSFLRGDESDKLDGSMLKPDSLRPVPDPFDRRTAETNADNRAPFVKEGDPAYIKPLHLDVRSSVSSHLHPGTLNIPSPRRVHASPRVHPLPQKLEPGQKLPDKMLKLSTDYPQGESKRELMTPDERSIQRDYMEERFDRDRFQMGGTRLSHEHLAGLDRPTGHEHISSLERTALLYPHLVANYSDYMLNNVKGRSTGQPLPGLGLPNYTSPRFSYGVPGSGQQGPTR